MISIPEKFLCPNCLSSQRLDDNMLFIIDEMTMPDNPEWHTIVCPVCGADFVITDEFRCFIPKEPISVSTKMHNELLAMKTIAAAIGAWRTKNPEKN